MTDRYPVAPLEADWDDNELVDPTGDYTDEELLDLATPGTSPYIEGSTDDIVAGRITPVAGSWVQKYQVRRDERQSSLWGGSSLGRGAKGITSWLGSDNFSYGWSTGGHMAGLSEERQLAVRLNQGIRFAADLARMAGRDKAKHIDWASETNPLVTSAGGGAVVLDPAVVRAIGKPGGPADQAEANSILGGQALHDGGHTRHTPAEAVDAYGSLASLHGLSREAAVAAGYLVEDTFVEAKVLDEYPGFQDYLDSHWGYRSPASAIVKALGDASTKLTQQGAIELIQDMARRYEPYTPEERATFDALPEATRRLLYHGARIMDRAHDPGLSLNDRQALASQLIRLLKDGEIPPEDLAEGEGPNVDPPEGGLNEALGELGASDTGHRGDGSPVAGDALDRREADAAVAEGALEREEDDNPWPAEGKSRGLRETGVTWVTPPINTTETRYYERAVTAAAPHVKRLARALHFRAASATRQQRGQLQGRLDTTALALAASGRNPLGTRRVFARKELLAAPRVHVSLLVDVSGSTSGGYDTAFRESAVMIDGALQNLEREARGSVTWDIHAHSSEYKAGSVREDTCYIYRIIDEKRQDRQRLGALYARSQNYDGEALFAVCRRLEKTVPPDRQKLLLYLNDGEPSGDGYGGAPAYKQIAWVCQQYRRKGFTIMTLFVGYVGDGLAGDLTTMYGPEGQGWLRIPSVDELPEVVGRVVSKQLYWKA